MFIRIDAAIMAATIQKIKNYKERKGYDYLLM